MNFLVFVLLTWFSRTVFVLHYVCDSFVHITVSLLGSALFMLYLCIRFVEQFSTLTECFAIFKWQILYSLPLVLQVVLRSQSNLCWMLWCFEVHCSYVCYLQFGWWWWWWWFSICSVCYLSLICGSSIIVQFFKLVNANEFVCCSSFIFNTVFLVLICSHQVIH